MICQRCLRRLSKRTIASPLLPSSSQQRSFSQSLTRRSTPETAQATPSTTPDPINPPLPPFEKHAPLKPSKRAAKVPASSVPAGTILKGINYLKSKSDPVALEDHEYPPWLWTVLAKADGKAGQAGQDGIGEADLFSKSKKERQRAGKILRKQQQRHPEALVPKVPLYEQTTDLPHGDGTIEGARRAGEVREELTGAMREKRRKAIKEDNFLRAMR